MNKRWTGNTPVPTAPPAGMAGPQAGAGAGQAAAQAQAIKMIGNLLLQDTDWLTKLQAALQQVSGGGGAGPAVPPGGGM